MTDKELYEKLKYERKNVYRDMPDEERRNMLDLADDYRRFLDAGQNRTRMCE